MVYSLDMMLTSTSFSALNTARLVTIIDDEIISARLFISHNSWLMQSTLGRARNKSIKILGY